MKKCDNLSCSPVCFNDVDDYTDYCEQNIDNEYIAYEAKKEYEILIKTKGGKNV